MNKKTIGLICILGVAVWVIGCTLKDSVEDSVPMKDEAVEATNEVVETPVKTYTENNNVSDYKTEKDIPTTTPEPLVEDVQEEEVVSIPEEAVSPSFADDDTQSYYEKGRELGQEVKEYLQDIDWDDKYEKARDAGERAADFVNGLLR